MSEYRDPLQTEVERLRAEVVELRERLPPSEDEPLHPYESVCPGCGKYPGVRTWKPSAGTGHFDCRCGTVIDLSDNGCDCRWKELTAADTKAVQAADDADVAVMEIQIEPESAMKAMLVGIVLGVVFAIITCSNAMLRDARILMCFPIGGALLGLLIFRLARWMTPRGRR